MGEGTSTNNRQNQLTVECMKGRPKTDEYFKRLHGMVETLRSEIAGGTYAAGETLPSEKRLAARFGLGNNSVRKGLSMLVEEGLIEKIPRMGNRVKMGSGSKQVKLRLVCKFVSKINFDLAELLAKFQRKYPWIRVDVNVTSYLPDADEHGAPFDVMLLDQLHFDWLAEKGACGQLAPLPERNEFYPMLNRLFMQSGILRAQPVIFSPVVLCYNKDHFRESGLPEPDGSWTWHDLLRAAEKLSNGKGRYGFGFPVPHINRWPIFLLQSGERFEWENGKLKDIRGTKLLNSIEMCKQIAHNRKAFPLYFSDSNNDYLRMFEEGKLSMVINSYMGLNLWKDKPLNYDISPIPFMDEPRTLVLCLGAAVHARSLHRQESKLLIDFLASPAAQRHIMKRTLSIPASAIVTVPARASESDCRRPGRYALFREIMSSYRTYRDLNIPVSSYPALFDQLRTYWADMMSEDELCIRIKNVLEAGGNPEMTETAGTKIWNNTKLGV